MSIKKMIEDTKIVANNFDRPWTAEARTLDLIEEVGELCNAILVQEGYKNSKRAKADLSDSLCDILFDIILLSDIYEVDIENQYYKMLSGLLERQKQKEFSD